MGCDLSTLDVSLLLLDLALHLLKRQSVRNRPKTIPWMPLLMLGCGLVTMNDSMLLLHLPIARFDMGTAEHAGLTSDTGV